MRLSKNFIWQFLGQGIGKGFTLIFYILLPRFLGLEAYGRFSFAFSLVLIIFQPCVEMGLDILITKWVSRKQFGILNKGLMIRGIMSLISLIITWGIAVIFNLDQLLILLILIFLILKSLQSAYFAAFRGLEKMRIEAIITLVQKPLPVLLLILFFIFNFKTIIIAPVSLLIPIIPGLIFCYFLALGSFSIPSSQPINALSYQAILKESLLLGGVAFLWILYFRIDSVMLGILGNNSQVGNYNLAYKLLEAFIFLPGIIMIVFFPKLAQPEQFTKVFNQLFLWLTVLGLGSVVILYFSSSGLIDLLYGANFLGAIASLKILAFVLFPIYLGHLTTQAMVALDCNRVYLFIVLGGTVLNIILNYFLIPALGAQGAAIATLITESMVMVLCGYWVSRIVPEALSIKAIIGTAKKNIS